jgi:hypothetical protein
LVLLPVSQLKLKPKPKQVRVQVGTAVLQQTPRHEALALLKLRMLLRRF